MRQNTPIASLHNALFFKECVNYFDDGARVSEYGDPTHLVRAVADNNYKTFTREKDLVINIAVGGQPTRVDAIFVKGKGITRHSGTPTGGSGSGWTDVDLPSTVKNWEGTDINTTVLGFQHHLLLMDQHFTATSVRVRFEGTNVEIYEILLLEFGIEIDANSDFTEIATNFVDRSGRCASGSGRWYQLYASARWGTRSMADRLCGEGCPWENAFGNAGGFSVLAGRESEPCACTGIHSETLEGISSGIPRKKCTGEV